MRRRIRGILMSGKQFSLDSRMDLVQGFKPIQPAQPPASGLAESDDAALPGTLEEEAEPGILKWKQNQVNHNG